MPLIIKHGQDVISARSNPLLVRICKLEEKKHREAERLFRLDGIKLLLEAIDFGADVEYIFVREDSYERIMDMISEHIGERSVTLGGTLVRVGSSAFEKLSNEKSPEGVITVAKYIDKNHKIGKIENNGAFSEDEKIIMLESVRDPGNLGTMLRTAAAFGFSQVIMSEDCADIYNPKVVRAAMGAIFKLSCIKTHSVTEAIAHLRKDGRRVLATALDKNAIRLEQIELKKSDVFLIGNEGHGLSSEAVSASDSCVFIPMTEGTESLNASIAASICMWEMSKL